MNGGRHPALVAVRIALVLAAMGIGFNWMMHRGLTIERDHVPATQNSVPPAMVGVWTSVRGGVMRCIELRGDGNYTLVPNAEAGDRFTSTGTWRIVGHDIIWHDDRQANVVDTNRMVDIADGHFGTLEADRSQARFDRLTADPAARCPTR